MNITGTKKMMAIFPIPVGSYQMQRDFTDNERKYFKSLYTKRTRNQTNWIGTDNNVLEDKPLTDLKDLVLECVNDYLVTVNGVAPGVEPYIVASWLNFAQRGESHHCHTHANCLFSGTLYIDVDEKTDSVVFHRTRPEVLSIFEFDRSKPTEWNKRDHALPVNNGMINVFPGTCMHYVPPVTVNSVRISLGFNVFVRGVVSNKVAKSLKI